MIRVAVRSLCKAPMFTALVVATMALGIGANTATFSVLKAVALNPLPYRDPDRLVTIAEVDRHTLNPQSSAYATMYEWRMRSRSFERLSMWGDYALRPLKQGRADFLRGMGVTSNFFDTLGIPMLLGRTFSPEVYRAVGSNADVCAGVGECVWGVGVVVSDGGDLWSGGVYGELADAGGGDSDGGWGGGEGHSRADFARGFVDGGIGAGGGDWGSGGGLGRW